MAFTNQKGRTQTSLSDINVTPFVDVLLVLLIIFMITAPVIQSGIDVDLPQTRTVRELTQERVVISIDAEQTLYVGKDPINIHALPDKLHSIMRDPERQFVYLQSDKSVPWGVVASVMDELHMGGIKNISAVTRPMEKAPGK